jgi:DNA segregation ATPase FtsK/SpoIIIE, S-DNA-T family
MSDLGKLIQLPRRTGTAGPGTDLQPYDDDSDDLFEPDADGQVAVRPAADVEATVVEGEVVDERAAQPERPIPVWSRRLPAPVQRAAASRTAEHVAIAAAGVASWTGRAVDGATLGTVRRQIRAAEADHDREALAEWVDRRREITASRHARWLALPKLAGAAIAAAVLLLIALLIVVLVLAVLAQVSGVASFTGVLHGTARLVAVLLWAGGISLALVTLAAPVLLFALAHREGTRRTDLMPSWVAAARPVEDDAASIVTPLGVAEALAHLGIATLTKAIGKDGWQVAFEMPPVRVNNRGYQTVFSLPLGVTPDMIADKRAVLARNLHRAPLEVWPAAATQAGYVDLWVADAGASALPTPPYPLLHAGEADVFTGVPIGVTQRGDVAMAPIVGANGVAGGQMGQGKSNLCRVVMLGCATDPIADLWVHVFAGNGDFDAYRPRLARYHRGSDEETVWAGLESLRELYEETGRREARLAQLGAKKLTRGIASKHPDMRPIVALFSECHELFGSTIPLYEGAPKAETVGRAAAEYAMKTIKRARKTGISLWFDTQSSRAAAIPPAIVELVGVNCCFAVKTWRSNDGFLGDGSFEAGIRATELRFNVDRGTCIAVGVSAEVFELVKTYFIAVDDDSGRDDAAPVIERVMTAYAAAGRPVLPETPAEQRDMLADLVAVLPGDEPVPVAEIPARLRHLAPRWLPYQRLNGKQLRAVLDEEFGYRVPSTGNTWPVSPAAIRAHLADQLVRDAE